MSTSIIAPVKLSAEKRPTYWFLQTINDFSKGYPRVRLLPNQWVPEEEGAETYFEGEQEWNIKCEREIRNAFPIGTTFVAKGIEIYRKCYNIPENVIYPLVTNGNGYQVAVKDMREEFELFKTGKTKPVAAPVILSASDSKPVSSGLLQIIQKDSRLTPPTAESGFYVDPDTWYLSVRNLQRKENTILVGPTGSGKTEFARLLAERLGLPISIFDMGAMHDPVAGLLGVHRLEEGRSVFDYSRFSQVISQPGVVVLDELSRPAASCNNILLPVLDGRKELPMEIAGSTGIRNVAVHPDCVFIATANLGHEYTGTTRIDRALTDRLFPMELDYMPKAEEAKVLVKRTGVALKQAENIAYIAEITRTKAANGELSMAVSHRHTLIVAQLVQDGFALIKSLERVILPLFEGSRSEGERADVRAILSSK